MNFGYKQSNKRNLFSEEIVNFFRRRSFEFLGFLLIILGVCSLFSLLTYSNQDMSWNTMQEGGMSHNIMGSFGSYLSDFFLQFIGLSSYLLSFLAIVWGTHVLLFHQITYLKWRLIALPFVLFFCSGGLAGMDLGFFIKSGGGLGATIHNGCMIFLAKIGLPGWLLGLLLFGIGITLFVMILGIPKAMWRAFGEVCWQTLKWGGRQIKTLLMSFAGSEKLLPMPLGNSVSQSQLMVEDSIEESSKVSPVAPSKKAEKSTPKGVAASLTAFSSMRSTAANGYQFPSLDLLQKETKDGQAGSSLSKEILSENSDRLKKILEDFGVEGEVLNAYPGPVVTLYEFKPAPGVKSSRVVGLADDIARSTSSLSTRISVIPGVNALGIEIPNPVKEKVFMRSLLEGESFNNPAFKLPLALGKNISGDPVIGDLTRMPHLLIAGTTGSGKSVSINTMIMSLLYRLSPEECKFIMIDPKMLELSVYDGIPHLLTPVVTDPHKAVMALKWVVREMESRYQHMSKLGVRNIEGYNERIEQASAKGETIKHKIQTGFDNETGRPLIEEHALEMKKFPFIVVVVDEMADLMLVAGKDIEAAVQRLAQMARAAGIHLIMATQRPSVDVITGTIKANFPTRISFHVTSKIDSRTILGEQGAEQLLGQGDMLYMKPGGRIVRVHGPFVEDREVERVVQFLRTQGAPVYEEAIGDEGFGSDSFGEDNESGDDLYDQALSIILRERKASTSFVQRHLQIGYNRAARIIEKMEAEGVVSKPNHVGKREILLNQ
jgi:DNA segregation ATPase FtsK/SpoIIIE, S-DNA-T family